MKRLLPLLFLVAAAGCAGIQIDAEQMTACVVQCLSDQPVLVINEATGDTVRIYPGDYREWIWNDDGTVTLKDKR